MWGFENEKGNVGVGNCYLTIGAGKGLESDGAENEEEQKKGNFIRKERYSGSCSRSFFVGEQLAVEDIKAKFEHGILKLTFPKEKQQQIETNKYVAIEG